MPKIDITLGPTDVVELGKPKHTALESVALLVIHQFLGMLPMKRDWLDPELEAFARRLLVLANADQSASVSDLVAILNSQGITVKAERPK